ncbi:PKD domain-containing protein [Arthrobacter sp. G.S.26]|uniref:PKD domain-containing protein n=1 Tax=Micrococcaceae TaxID=1268 RepID=UPI0025549D13|nr:PKD domain-containing protein [Pseudarthrobacter sp. MEB009]
MRSKHQAGVESPGLTASQEGPPPHRGPRSLLVMVLSAAMALSLGVVWGAAPATADSAPAPDVPLTVTADRLPTAQHNGVGWTQLVIGNKVYVGGEFTMARPAGAAPGTQEVVRNNILAYDIRTGVLDPTFHPSMNGEVTSLAASPDGSRLYVGGSFTAIDGATVWRVAALNPTTGSINTSFLPRMSASVRAIVATDTTVYMGGLFNGVGTVTRDRLAAAAASNGALLPWNPVAVGGRVNALALSPDKASMVVGGAFTTLNGSANPGYGLGKVDTNLGASQPFQINNIVRNGSTGGSITALATDGTNVYGSGYTFGRASTLEGIFSVKWADSSTEWIEDCHGDSYSVFPIGDVVYQAGHPHYCGNVGGFPQAEPWEFQRALAFSKKATGVLTQETHGYTNFGGNPAPSQLNWFPYMSDGTFTGQNQGPWSVSGNADYVVYSGEFTNVNSQAQQGMVRFAKSTTAPNLRGPKVTGANFAPTLSTPAPGQVRVRWQANWDQDNENLVYEVRRDNVVIATLNQASRFWNRPGMTFLDTNRVAGRSYAYRIYARDAFNNQAVSDIVRITATDTVAAPGAYSQTVLSDAPANYWPLGDAAGTTGVDLAGKDDLVLRPGVTLGADGAVGADGGTAATFNGTADSVAARMPIAMRPQTFSTEAWFKTGSTTGGGIISYGNSPTGVSTDFDRTVYMSNTGRLFFGVRPNGATRQTINSTASFNDNQWHHVVATLGSNGMQLFVDGVLVGSRADVTSAWQFDGFWRLGGDNLGSWSNRPTSRNINGQIDDVAIYPAVLPLSRIQAHYVASGRTVSAPPAAPVARFAAAVDGLKASVDGTASSDANGPIAGYAWDFGDGGTGTGVKADHTYAAGGTFNVTLTVTDNTGQTNAVTNPVTVTAPPPNQVPVAGFTSTATNLAAAFNAGTSADPDGTIAAYAWDFGDTTSDTGATPSHTYAAAGTYNVTLTVTDDDGATGSLTKAVTVQAPPANTVLAADDFGRTTASGWGAANTGGAWSVAGTAAAYTVGNGVGNLILATGGVTRTAILGGVSAAATDVQVKASLDKIGNGGGTFVSVIGRRVGSDDYRVKVKVPATGAGTLYLTRIVGGAETVISTAPLTGLTLAPGDAIRIRMQVTGTGTSTLQAKVWRDTAAEPAAWLLTSTDTTAALQAPGTTGLVGYLSGSATNVPITVRFDDYSVKVP